MKTVLEGWNHLEVDPKELMGDEENDRPVAFSRGAFLSDVVSCPVRAFR
jgi:hypothetical protein